MNTRAFHLRDFFLARGLCSRAAVFVLKHYPGTNFLNVGAGVDISIGGTGQPRRKFLAACAAGERICMGGGNRLAQGSLGTPAKVPKFGDVQKLLLRAIGP
jgi:hypothetical protein